MDKNNNNNSNDSSFAKLYAVDVSSKISKKMNLSYLSWADAWAELKKLYPDAEYKIYTRSIDCEVEKVVKIDESTTITTRQKYTEEIPYFTDDHTCFVKVGVVINGNEQDEIFPVMNNKMLSVSADMVTMTDVNRALQRAFVKACARHGLGLYVYAGEDLPEDKRINIPQLIREADRKAVLNIDAATFANYKASIIGYIKMMSDSNTQVDSNLYNYIQSLFPNQKLSTLTYEKDKEGVAKLYYIIEKIS